MGCVLTIVLGGVPASGKTHVMRLVRDELFPGWLPFSHKAPGDRHAPLAGIAFGPFRMLGVFDGTRYEGTDRLDKAIRDNALDYIRTLEECGKRVVVLAEGDRLFNRPFIDGAHAVPLLIAARPPVLEARRRARNSVGEGHTARFLRGFDTKIANMARDYNLAPARCDSEWDARRIARSIARRARAWAL